MIKLYNKLTVTAPYSGKTKISFWKNLEVGDVINLTIKIKRFYRTDTPYVTMVNTRTNDIFNAGFNDFNNRLGKFGYRIHEA